MASELSHISVTDERQYNWIGLHIWKGFVRFYRKVTINADLAVDTDTLLVDSTNDTVTMDGDVIVGAATDGLTTIKDAAATTVASFSGATMTATALIPAGTLVLGVTVRVTTLITGATSFDVGDGTDVDRWGAAIAVALNTTTGIANFTISSPVYYTAATNVVFTANGSNFTAGAVKVRVHSITLTAPTA